MKKLILGLLLCSSMMLATEEPDYETDSESEDGESSILVIDLDNRMNDIIAFLLMTNMSN